MVLYVCLNDLAHVYFYTDVYVSMSYQSCIIYHVRLYHISVEFNKKKNYYLCIPQKSYPCS